VFNVGSSTPTFSYSIIANSGGSGVGSWVAAIGSDNGNNKDADPQFITPVNPANAPTTAGNLRLQAGSPAIDMGDDTAVPADAFDVDDDGNMTEPTPDLALNDRIFGTVVDMGAYESGVGSIKALKFNDLNENGMQDNGEPNLLDWAFTLSDDNGVVATGNTDSDGCVTFEALPLGDYEICETLQNGWANSTPLCQTVELTVPLNGNSEPNGATFINEHLTGIPDPATGINGVKWELQDNFDGTGGNEDDSGTFSITFDVAYESASVPVAVAGGGPSGGETGQSTITGPSCMVRTETTELPPDNNAQTVTTGNGDSYVIQFLGTTDNGRTWEYRVDELNDRSLLHWVLGIELCSPAVMVSFGNYQITGNITIVKTASPTSAGTSFSFSGNLGNFSLDGSNDGNGNEYIASNLQLGSYTISEATLSGWTLADISISGDTDDGSSIDLDMGTIDVDLDAGEDITITFTNEIIPPSFSKVFAPAVIGSTATSTLTFTIDNSTAPLDATALDFTDNLPNNVVVAATPNASTTCTGGTLTATAGAGTITYTGGTVTAGSSCTVSVDVTSSIPGIYANTTSDLTSSLGNSGTAMANLTVEPPPVFDKDFSPGTICLGQTSTVTFTIDNTASALAASALDFTDNLPAGMVVATIPNASTTCTAGTLTANAGSGVITYTGGTVAAGATCTVQVDVTTSSFGFLNNSTGNLTSSNGNSGTANATLQVEPQVVINDLNPQTICSTTKKQPLTELYNGIVYTGDNAANLTFEWSIKETDGDNGTLDDLNNNVNSEI